ncbi:THUMP domain-containing protein 1 homolog [Toxorhynchites rutilus septentrionalis]|uniref:THUMP domain-containing protein 1 homolog n=1 Tax=Toxorhynchites rutilus septentrionalis TaxID=329112 RepID=UPI002478C814|nr:THUMP domain-containing protein 1 homolog [Toxorhynchites rutilus septentrionalis]
MSTEAKRPKMDGKFNKAKMDKKKYYAKAQNESRRKNYIEPGQRGFMVTCNMRERECIRDSFRLLNEYADLLYGKLGHGEEKPAKDDEAEQESEKEEDISELVQKQAEAIRTEKRQFRFESVDSGAKNVCFITTILEDPKELGLKILHDLMETKKLKSRNILRLLPIEAVTRANLKDIMDTAGGLFDKYFLKEPKTFAIIFNRRFNNGLDREDVIKELAGLISAKNAGNKANLKNPELAVIVEVIKGLCLISVVPEYFQLKKYNLVEICTRKEDSEKVKDNEESRSEVTKDNGKNISEELDQEKSEEEKASDSSTKNTNE